MDTNNNTFKVINEEGVEITCDILFTFDNADNGKSYIVYTDNTRDAYGNIQVFASVYDPTAKMPKLEPIETQEEWAMIETILDSLQDNIRSGNKQDVNEIVNAVLDDLNDEEDDIMDDFNMYDDYMNNDDRYMIVKLHFYEKANIFDYSTHAPHYEMGEAVITGEAGKFTIGSSLMSDIRIKNNVDVKHLHIMGVLLNKKLYISNISLEDATLNHRELPKALDDEEFFEIEHKQYFTIGNRIKVYVELLDQYKMIDKKCSLCGKEFFSMSEDDEYCVDCFKQIEEDMKLDLSDKLNRVDFKKLLLSQVKDDLDIVVEACDKKKPQLLQSFFDK